jgi:hypothetical protein
MLASTVKQKLFLLLFLLLLVGCIPTTPNTSHIIPTNIRSVISPTITPTIFHGITPTLSSTRTPAIAPTVVFHTSFEAFDISDDCPYICWLGINPGVTNIGKAGALMAASDQIDQKTFQVAKTYIVVDWFFQKTVTWTSQVSVNYEKGLVKSITIYDLQPATMTDMLRLLGEPDEIRMIQVVAPDHAMPLGYAVYYASRKTVLYAVARGTNGPGPDDTIWTMILNADEFKNHDCPPWLGYEHLQDYLSMQSASTYPCPSPTPAP